MYIWCSFHGFGKFLVPSQADRLIKASLPRRLSMEGMKQPLSKLEMQLPKWLGKSWSLWLGGWACTGSLRIPLLAWNLGGSPWMVLKHTGMSVTLGSWFGCLWWVSFKQLLSSWLQILKHIGWVELADLHLPMHRCSVGDDRSRDFKACGVSSLFRWLECQATGIEGRVAGLGLPKWDSPQCLAFNEGSFISAIDEAWGKAISHSVRGVTSN